jgi:uncharacterized delta-60 repeat protein
MGVAALNSLPLGLGITGAAIDGTGRVVIVGTTPDIGPEGNDIFVARLTTAGVLDPTFGNGGVARFAISVVDGRSDQGTAVAVQPDGKIVVGGRTQVTAGLGFDFVLLRLSANGAFDGSFVNGGVATTRFAGTTGPTSDASSSFNRMARSSSSVASRTARRSQAAGSRASTPPASSIHRLGRVVAWSNR